MAVRTCDGVEIRESYRDERNKYRDVTMDNIHGNYIGSTMRTGPDDILSHDMDRHNDPLPSSVMQAMIGVNFIADHLRQQDDFNKVSIREFLKFKTCHIWQMCVIICDG